MTRYKLIRSKRRKTFAIEVHRDQQVVVRAPAYMDQNEICRLVARKTEWIHQQQQRQASLPQKPAPTSYHDGSEHYFLGETLRLKYASVSQIFRQNDSLLVPEKWLGLNQQTQNFSQTETALRQWYRQQAEVYFQQRLTYWLENISHWRVDFSELKLRYMRRCWGNCNSRGKITLNVQLVKTPPPLIDYVISHECCHLKEMNHSPAFYQLQETLMSDWQQRRQLIRDWERKLLP